MTQAIGFIIAMSAALSGAAAFALLGVPAGGLLGAALAVAVCAYFGARPAVPDLARNAAFVVIGVSLGSGITSNILADIARWPVSLIGLTVTMLAIMVVSGALLTRVFGIDRITAALSASPGALSYAVAAATSGKGDLRSVVTLQSQRLLMVTLCLPPLIGGLAGMGVPLGAGEIPPAMGLASAALIILAALGLGWVLSRFSVPAPYLMAGLAISGGAHFAGWLTGGLAQPILQVGFVVTGAVIGSRFTKIARGDLARLATAGIAITAVSVGISAIGAAVVSALTGFSFASVWVAFAPGGVEGMAAMGLALGLDPAFIATHHIFRIFLVILAMQFFLRHKPPQG